MSWIYKIGRILLLGPFYKLLGPAKAESQSAKACGQSANVAGRAASGSFLGSIAKSLFMSAIVIGASFALMLVNPTLGVIAMMVYSSYMVINSSRKEIPLNKFTSLLPGVMAIVTFLVMLGLIRSFDGEMAMLGMVPGAVVGFLMARGHKVYSKNGIVYAKRTFFYIVIWAFSMLITQGSTLLGVREITEFSSMLNGFSTAMMVVLSVFLFMKSLGGVGPLRRAGKVAVVFMLVLLYAVSTNQLEAIAADDYWLGKWRIDSNNIGGKKYSGTINIHREYGELYATINLTNGKTNKFPIQIYGQEIRIDIKRLLKFLSVNNYQSKKGPVEYYNDWVSGKIATPFPPSDNTGGLVGSVMGEVSGGLMAVMKTIRVTRSGTLGNICYIHSQNISKKYGGNFQYGEEKTEQFYCERLSGGGGLVALSTSSSPSPSYQPNYDPQPDYYSHSDFEFSDGEQIAGVLLALMLLLTSVGMNAAISAAMSGAMTAAQEAANAATATDYVPTGNRVLDGDEAKDWMRDNGYLDENGKPNKKFHQFMDSKPSESGPGLQGITGEFDDEGNPTGDYAIVIPDDTPSTSEPEKVDVKEAVVFTTSLKDPDDGEPLVVQNGEYEGGKKGQVWYDEKWMDENEAREKIAQRQQEIDRENRENEKRLEEFERQNELERKQRNADREKRLRDEHNIYDEDQQAWVKDPNYTPPRTKLEEFYDRVDYLDEHRHELSDGKKEAVDRILDRMGYKDDIIDEKELGKEDSTILEDIRRLTKSVADIRSGDSGMEQANAEHDAAKAQFGEDVSTNIKKTGKLASEIVEKHYLNDMTKGGITNFIYSVASNHNKDIGDNLYESGMSTIKTVTDNLSGDLSKRSSWRVFKNAAWASGEEIYKGSDATTTAQAVLEKVLGGEIKEVVGKRVKIEEMNINVKNKVLRSMLHEKAKELSGRIDRINKILDHRLSKGSIKL